MKLLHYKLNLAITLSLLLLLTTSCKAVDNANNKQKGGVIGTAGGALLGAIIGNNVGDGNNSELGAVIGGVVGGTTGVLIGKKWISKLKTLNKKSLEHP